MSLYIVSNHQALHVLRYLPSALTVDVKERAVLSTVLNGEEDRGLPGGVGRRLCARSSKVGLAFSMCCGEGVDLRSGKETCLLEALGG